MDKFTDLLKVRVNSYPSVIYHLSHSIEHGKLNKYDMKLRRSTNITICSEFPTSKAFSISCKGT